MDLSQPLRSVSPGVDSDVLGVLASTHAPLTGNRVALLAGRSYAQVRAVLRRLVAHGLVNAERIGNAVAYALNREHVAAGFITGLTDLHAAVEQRIHGLLADWTIQPHAVVAFGSFARRDGDEHSDIDLLLVRPPELDEDDPLWAEQRYELASGLERWTGNRAQIIDLAPDELLAATEAEEPLIASLTQEGQVLLGPELRALLATSRKASG